MMYRCVCGFLFVVNDNQPLHRLVRSTVSISSMQILAAQTQPVKLYKKNIFHVKPWGGPQEFFDRNKITKKILKYWLFGFFFAIHLKYAMSYNLHYTLISRTSATSYLKINSILIMTLSKRLVIENYFGHQIYDLFPS